MRIAVLSSRFPFPLERGDKLRLYHQLKGLSARHELHLYTLADGHVTEKDIEHLRKICCDVTIVKSTLWQKVIGFIKALRYSWPFQTGLSYSKTLHRKFLEDLDKKGIDAIFCQLIRMAPYAINVQHHTVLDYMDAFGVGMQRRSQISRWPLNWIYAWEAKRVKDFERSCAPGFDERIIITQEDKKALDLPESSCAIVPNGIDTVYFHPGKTTAVNFDVGFVGNLGYLPNIGAARFLIQDIGLAWFNKYGSSLKILVAGARPDSTLTSLATDFVVVQGWMEDIREAYASIQILVAPIFFGTGQQNKIMEAMACGVPVICSSEVAKGVGAIHLEHLLIANTAVEFVEAITQLKHDEDLRLKISQQALEYVKNHFSWEKSVQILDKLLDAKYLA
ncbi:MAG: glycosyltransferase [Saprospiraceae bacterium]